MKILGMNVGMSGYATLTRPTELPGFSRRFNSDISQISMPSLLNQGMNNNTVPSKTLLIG